MGNTSSTRHPHEDTVDHGHLAPQGVYAGPQDWNHAVVAQLIVDRKLAPFYRPLEDHDDSWDSERIIAAMKDPTQQSSAENSPSSESFAQSHPTPRPSVIKHSRAPPSKESPRMDEAILYKGAIECPICFLYYPPNINRSRCCDHPICTECFVQIKRSEPSPTHLSSEPACCPYCVRDNFGVIYEPPSWRAGAGSENYNSTRQEALQPAGSVPHTIRRKSFSADSTEVVTTDQIRPDWEEKLAAVRAAVQRRANRRIIMRQVGDRLIPVGVTSGRIHAVGQDLPSGGDGQSEPIRGSRRRRGGGGQAMDVAQFLGLSGQDIEELMVMEAMRLSLAEHEEAQRRNENQSNRTSNAGTPQSDSTPTPMSVVLSNPRPTARDSNVSSPDSGPQLARSANSRVSDLNLQLAASHNANAVNNPRTPSPQPNASAGHQRSQSAIASLAMNAGAVAGLSPDISDTLRDHNERTPERVSSEQVPTGGTPSSAASTSDAPETYSVLHSSSEADSLTRQPLLSTSPMPSTTDAKNRDQANNNGTTTTVES